LPVTTARAAAKEVYVKFSQLLKPLHIVIKQFVTKYKLTPKINKKQQIVKY